MSRSRARENNLRISSGKEAWGAVKWGPLGVCTEQDVGRLADWKSVLNRKTTLLLPLEQRYRQCKRLSICVLLVCIHVFRLLTRKTDRQRIDLNSRSHVPGREMIQRVLSTRNEMNIFISWSGERSNRAALGLKSLLEAVFQRDVQVFVSEYISPGENWVQRIQAELKQSQIGIVCLTHDNFQTPWLLFEAGAVAIALGSDRVLVPYAVDALSDAADRSPLAMFQRVRADHDGTYKLVQNLNQARKDPEDTKNLQRYFDKWWPDLEETLKSLPAPLSDEAARGSDRQILENILDKITVLLQMQKSSSELPGPELRHLLNLRDQPETKYKTRSILKRELRHLRDLGYISNAQPIQTLPEEFELARLFSLTDKGKHYLEQFDA